MRWKFWQPRAEKRFQFSNPPIPSNAEYGGSFAAVDLRRAESGSQKVAVWAAVNFIASMASTLPIDAYVGRGKSKREAPLTRFFADPDGEGFGVEDWAYRLVMSLLLRGNAYGLVPEGARDELGRPTQIVLQHPDDCHCWLDWQGRRRYVVAGIERQPWEVWHKRVFPVPGMAVGLSPITHHALTIGLGLSAQRYGAQFFTDGAHPSGMLTNSEIQIDEPTAKEAKARFMQSIRGTREPAALGKGWSYTPIQVNPEDSQFLETNKYTDAECARIYGPGMPEILGYETGASLTYQNRVDRNQDLLTFALDPWLVRLEKMYSELLPSPRYVKMNRDALLRMTPLDRWRVHEIGLRSQATFVNEVRELEDRTPVPWGDEPNQISAGPTPVKVEEG